MGVYGDVEGCVGCVGVWDVQGVWGGGGGICLYASPQTQV